MKSPTLATQFNPTPGKDYDLPQTDSWQATKHLFDEESVLAVKAAMAARRPLLIRGEPGVGKSQVARAVATVINAPFIPHVINARVESDELLYSFDAVSRLARAQLMGAANYKGNFEDDLNEARYVSPGCLWWAFDWAGAAEQAKHCISGGLSPQSPEEWDRATTGCVVLIDEIDKADTDVPNSLLESLGNTGFYVPYLRRSVTLKPGMPQPFVVITTNEERELPAAFLRRCLVYHMKFPADANELEKRARVHFIDGKIESVVYQKAAKQLLEDRRVSRTSGIVVPGFAEYLDLLTALDELYPDDESGQLKGIKEISRFAFEKNPEEHW